MPTDTAVSVLAAVRQPAVRIDAHALHSVARVGAVQSTVRAAATLPGLAAGHEPAVRPAATAVLRLATVCQPAVRAAATAVLRLATVCQPAMRATTDAYAYRV
jgi:hypothetical protein